ncbi:MAG: hypothetical protein ACSLEN_10405 [Candidatus Malihini olakiniferum]
MTGLGLAYNKIVANFTAFLSLLRIFISPIAGVYLAEYYLLGAKYITQNGGTSPAVNVSTCVAWIIGCGASLLMSLELGSKLTITTVSALDGISVSMIAYVALNRIIRKG